MGKVSIEMMNGYNIALHGIRAPQGSKKIAESIMENGLIMRSGTNSIRCTTIQLGDEYRNKNFKDEVLKIGSILWLYFYGEIKGEF